MHIPTKIKKAVRTIAGRIPKKYHKATNTITSIVAIPTFYHTAPMNAT